MMSDFEVVGLLIRNVKKTKSLGRKIRIDYQEFVQIALTDKDHGYYMNKNVFNKEGDFITSPELSQIFGEIIGLWHANIFIRDEIQKEKKQIIEIGAGSGKLLMVMINVLQQFDLLQNTTINLLDISPFLRNLQQENISKVLFKNDIIMNVQEKVDFYSLYNEKLNFKIKWFPNVLNGLKLIQKEYQQSYFICHEFFDALPHSKFQYFDGFWHEKTIKLENIVFQETKKKYKHFTETLSLPNSPSVQKILNPTQRFGQQKIKEGSEIEISPVSSIYIDMISQIISKNKGTALIIDYGQNNHFEDSLLVQQKGNKKSQIHSKKIFIRTPWSYRSIIPC